MILEKNIAEKVLTEAVKTGGDFAELFIEETKSQTIEHSKKEISNVSNNIIYGAGIRILKDNDEVYGYTNDLSLNSLLNLVYKLRDHFKNPLNINFKLKEKKIPNINEIKKNYMYNQDKVNLLDKVSNYAYAYDDKIYQVIVKLIDKDQHIEIYNTEGLLATDYRKWIRLYLTCVAKDGNNIQQGSSSLGGNIGFELFDNFDFKNFANEASKQALNMLKAVDIKPGVYPVVLHNGFGGVILHEAIGHSLEATSVATGLSVMTNLKGKRIASELVTAIDDGTMKNEWGSLNIDDEGTPTTRNVLIKDGILNNYMIDKKNDRKMKQGITGCGRRQSYKYSPTSRMTNTYILPGKSSFEDIIKNTKFGLFAKSLGGGSVNPTTGEYNFAVNEGYMIEDGKITYPVKGATLVGQGKETLLNVDMVGNNLELSNGMCGSVSGSIEVNVGQPTIRVAKITVGGKGDK